MYIRRESYDPEEKNKYLFFSIGLTAIMINTKTRPHSLRTTRHGSHRNSVRIHSVEVFIYNIFPHEKHIIYAGSQKIFSCIHILIYIEVDMQILLLFFFFRWSIRMVLISVFVYD